MNSVRNSLSLNNLNSKMNKLQITCHICFSHYDHSDHEPRIIPTCYHTLCSSCIQHMLSSEKISLFECPICKSQFQRPSLSLVKFPKNFAILEALNPQTSDACQAHMIRKDQICFSCNSIICTKCILGQHQDHDFKPLENFEQEVKNRIKELEFMLSGIKSYMTSVERILATRKADLRSIVELEFENLISQIKDHEEVVLKEIDKFFEDFQLFQIPPLNETSQGKGVIDLKIWRNEISELISKCKNADDPIILNKELFGEKELDLDRILSFLHVNEVCYAESFLQGLKIEFNEKIKLKCENFCLIKFSPSPIKSDMKNVTQLALVRDSELQNPMIMSIINQTIIESSSRGFMKLKYRPKSKKSELRDITNFLTEKDAVQGFMIISKDFRIESRIYLYPFFAILWNLAGLSTLELYFNESEFNKGGLEVLMDGLSYLVGLRVLKIELNKTKESHSFSSKIAGYLNTFKMLKTFSLSMKDSDVNSKQISEFSLALSKLSRLSSLLLNLEDCQKITSEGFISLFQAIRRLNLKTLLLDLQGCANFNEDSLLSLCDMIENSTMIELEGIHLHLGGFQKSSNSWMRFFSALGKLKSLKSLGILFTNFEQIGDPHLQLLGSSFKHLKIENMQIGLKKCGKITDEGVFCLADSIKKIATLTKLELSLHTNKCLTKNGYKCLIETPTDIFHLRSYCFVSSKEGVLELLNKNLPKISDLSSLKLVVTLTKNRETLENLFQACLALEKLTEVEMHLSPTSNTCYEVGKLLENLVSIDRMKKIYAEIKIHKNIDFDYEALSSLSQGYSKKLTLVIMHVEGSLIKQDDKSYFSKTEF